MFRDEASVEVAAGKGGDGLVSFRREKYVPRGGPDGGDGGAGGDVIFAASGSVHSLLDVGRRHRYVAESGRPGGPRLRTGRSGADLVVELPIGTQVLDAERGNLLFDLTREGERVVVARGGRGGHGNARFATAVRQAPRKALPGMPGEARRVNLVLKLFAEVGLVGLPNAGKSTFLSCVTAARPKIAAYPFTTLVPEVGIARVGDEDTLVLADLPGLIAGAAEGHGLGHRFLKHVERCRVLLHLVDVSSASTTDPAEALATVAGELEAFSGELARKPRLLVATKCWEDGETEARIEALEQAAGVPVLGVNALQGRGLRTVLGRARELVRGDSRPGPSAVDP